MTNETGFCATCGFHKNAHGNIAVTDCAEYSPEERPEPGKLPIAGSELVDENGISVHRHDQLRYARDGDVGAAILRTLVRRREKAANDLHYQLRRLSESLDSEAIKLEQGKRHMMSSSAYDRLPKMIEVLNDLTGAVEEAEVLIDADKRSTSTERTVFRLERAAEALTATDSYAAEANAVIADEVEDMPKIVHPLVPTILAEAKALSKRSTDADNAARLARELAADRERAKRLKRPLGSYEMAHLKRALQNGNGKFQVSWRLSSLSAKAGTNLVERGFAVQTKNDEREYTLTKEGREAAKALGESARAKLA